MKYFTFFTCMFFFFVSQAQNDTPSKDVIFIEVGEPETKVASDKKKYKHTGLILKTSPISYIFGNQYLQVEKEIGNELSILGSIGANFEPLHNFESYTIVGVSNDHVRNFGVFYESENFNSSNDITDEYNTRIYRKQKPSTYFDLGLRYYFSDYIFEGMFLYPIISYSTYSFEAQQAFRDNYGSIVYNSDQTQSENRKHLNFIFRLGYQQVYHRVSFDFYVGAGASRFWGKGQDLGNVSPTEIGNLTRNYTGKGVVYQIGFTFGFFISD